MAKKSMEFYLDNAATTPVLSEVLDKALPYLKADYGNPSSVHKKGMDASRALKEARHEIAKALEVSPNNVIFCSGGTEGNHLSLLGAVHSPQLHGKQIIVSGFEHACVYRTAQWIAEMGYQVDFLEVTPEGVVDLDHLKSLLSEETRVVSCMAVNNEIGTEQPLLEVGKLLREASPNAIFHVDATQGLMKIPMMLKAATVDVITCSGHKIGAPKGSGALIKINAAAPLHPVSPGGGQEFGMRSGTQNVFAAVALGEAVRLKCWNQERRFHQLKDYRQQWVSFLQKEFPQIYIYDSPHVLPYYLNIALPKIPAEVFLHHLEAAGIYVSAGSACSSRKTQTSHVLQAVQLPGEVANSLIRISFSEKTLELDQKELFKRFKSVVEELLELF